MINKRFIFYVESYEINTDCMRNISYTALHANAKSLNKITDYVFICKDARVINALFRENKNYTFG